jgi:hypothetical protein
MLDWGHAWPLWENGTSKYALTPDDLDLSPNLRERMRAWYDSWEREYDENMGWGAMARQYELHQVTGRSAKSGGVPCPDRGSPPPR